VNQAAWLRQSTQVRTKRISVGRLAAAIGIVAGSVALWAPQAPATTTIPATTTPAATASPDANLQNLQVVTISWSGFKPTAATPNFQGYYQDMVGIIECTANPQGGHYYFYRDCMVNATPGNTNAGAVGGDGNMVGFDANTIYGVTAPDGTGSYPFQVESGTLHNNALICNASNSSQCDSPSNIQCDSSNPCVAKVIDYPNFQPFPTTSWETITPGDYTSLLDAAPSVPLNFGVPPSCPPGTQGNLAIEGESSASYALQQWAAAVCQGSSPLTINYAQVGEAVAKHDFLAGSTNVAVAGIPPSAAQIAAASGAPSFTGAPLDAGGISIAFDMRDAVTDLPVATVRLTPRLVAMLITNSGTLDNYYTLNHPQAFAPANTTFVQAMTADPEFLALNPPCRSRNPDTPPGCFTAPAFVTGSGKSTSYTFYVEEPMLRAEHNDDTAILTQWIASDYDAQQYLQGKDPCGAHLNAYWQGVNYPTDQFQDLEQGGINKEYADFYFPVQGTPTVVSHLLYVKPVGFYPTAPPQPPAAVVGLPSRNSAYFAVLDTVTARRSAMSQASLIAANPTQSELANLVTESGGTCTPKSLTSYPGFVAPDDAGLAAGYQAMTTEQPTSGIYASPVAATDPTAYPLAKIDYAIIPTSGLSPTTAGSIASFLQFTAGPGQTPANLAAGYPPLPASMAGETSAAAATVLKSVQTSPPPTSTPPTSTPATTHPPTTSHPTVPPAVTGSSFSTSFTPSSLSPADRTSLRLPAPSSGPVTSAPTSSAPGAEQKVALAAEGAVSVGAASLVGGTWLLPLALGLGLCSALAGGILVRDGRRRARRSAVVTGEAKP
jgi:hypothetical protein